MAPDRNILIISYYFPPLGLGGVGRSLGLAKYLPKFGYNVSVLTVKDIAFPEYDYSLLEGVDQAEIIRAGSLDPSRIIKLLKKRIKEVSADHSSGVLRYFYLPDLKRGWNLFARRKAKALIKRKRIDAMITLSPPPSTHLIGLALKQKYDIPWAADFRDAWFSEPIEKIYSAEWQKKYALKLKNRIIASADRIVTVYSAIRDYLGKGQTILNGAELDYVKSRSPVSQKEKGKFIIGVMGTINRLSPIEPLFKALDRIIKNYPEFKNKIAIEQVGSCDEKYLQTVLEKYPINDLLIRRGYRRRREAFGLLAGADLLYLGVFSSRTFDCLMTGKPVLGVISDNAVSPALYSPDMIDLVKSHKYGRVFAARDEDGIYSYIKELCRRSVAGETTPLFDVADAEKYSTLRMAREYAALLDGMIK
jgi:glycosyltransferase involved in cell wall biosynthesis